MELVTKNAGGTTPVKESHGSRSKNQESSRNSENTNPNLSHVSPAGPKHSSSKSAKSQKSAPKNPNPVVIYSPQHKIRQRKFVRAKKNQKKEDKSGSVVTTTCKCKDKSEGNPKKCLCVAYENLRASQEEFFKNPGNSNSNNNNNSEEANGDNHIADTELEEVIEMSLMIKDLRIEEDRVNENAGDCVPENAAESPDQLGSSTVKRRRDKLLEEARSSVPESGSGRVMHLVKAFEKLRSLPVPKGSSDEKEEEKEMEKPEERKKQQAMKWALPGLEFPKETEAEASSSSFCPSGLLLTSENLGLDSRFVSVSSSWDSSRGRFVIIIKFLLFC